MKEKNEGLVKDAYELILGDIQTILAVLYVLMIGLGMLFKYKIYAEFGINIFDYADVFDFLIAPFQDISIIIAAFLATIIPIAIIRLDFYSQRWFPKMYTVLNFGWNKKNWYNKFRMLAFWGLLVWCIFETTSGYARHIKHSIDSKENIAITYVNNEMIKGKMIGKTKEVIFLLKGKEVKVIPLSFVKEMDVYHLK